MDIRIRLAIKNDIDNIKKMWDELNDYLAEHENYPRWKKGVYPSREHAEEGVKKDSLYVAIDGEKVIGTIVLSCEQEEAYRSVNWQIGYNEPVTVICKLAVHPDYFGYGIGKELLAYADIIGRRQGSKAIRLDTYKENLPAIRLYEKSGFKYMGLVDLGLEEIYGLKWYKVFEKIL